MIIKECPECGHRWRWDEKTLFTKTWQTDDGWRTLSLELLPSRRPKTGWMADGLIWRRVVSIGWTHVSWLRFDVKHQTPEELSEILYRRTGFLTTEKREELGLDDDQASRS